MNREQTKKLLAERSEQDKVMQHFVDGGLIECRISTKSDWSYINDPAWNWIDFDYRIKCKLPEVGKWYTSKGYKYKCVARDLNAFVFAYKEGIAFMKPENDDFTDFKQVEP